MERKLLALVLVGAGVWVQWGPGFALIVLGVLLAWSGVEAETVRAWSRRPHRVWERSRDLAVAMPRRTIATVLIVAAIVLLPIGSALAAGTWTGLIALGGLALGLGVALAWETHVEVEG
jgi:uncharacterized membrane protein YqaE (UPF0057 family)